MRTARRPSADRDTDAQYAQIRARFGERSGRANGYRLHHYFVQEQKLLLALLGEVHGVVLDLACGSGLMGLPLAAQRCTLVGVDFNAEACTAAASNGLIVIRGDAYALPFGDGTVDAVFSCQFFNQQAPEKMASLMAECARIAKPGAKVIFVWRNHRAWIHQCAHAFFRAFDRIAGRPQFPVHDHPLLRITELARTAGFSPVDLLVSLPLVGWHSRDLGGLAARALGASAIIVLKRTP